MAGFGVEHALSRNVTARVEYNHIDLGTETHNLGLTVLGVPIPGVTIPTRVNMEMDTIKLGVSFKLN